MLSLSRKFAVCAVVAALLLALVPAVTDARAAGGGVIAYGESVTGQITAKVYYQLYQFDGVRGDRVTITMTGDGSLDPYLGLIDGASEEVLVEDDDSAGNSNALIEYSLPANGSYIIVATRYGLDTGTSVGSFTLELQGGKGPGSTTTNISNQQSVSEPQMLDTGIYLMGTIAIGDQVSGEITGEMFAQLYEMQVEAGTELIVGMFADGSNLDPYLIVLNENGDVLAEDDDSGAEIEGAGRYDSALSITFPDAGYYYIAATRAGVAQGQSLGAYALMVVAPDASQQQQQQDVPAGVMYMDEITLGSTVTGAIDNTTFVLVYPFSGSVNQQVTITAAGADGLDAYLGIMDADGNILAEDDDSGGGAQGLDAQISIKLPETGDYAIIVTRSGIDAGTTVGSFTLTVSDGAPVAPAGNTGIGGFGGLPGRALESEQGTFYLRGFGKSSDPAKATPLQQFINPPSEDALPGRSMQAGTESFYLTGFGKSDDPAKATPLQAYMNSHQ